MVLIVAICFIVYGRVYRKHMFDGVTYRCYFRESEVYQGDDILFVEEVSNGKYLPISWLKAEITTSKYLTFSERCSAVTYASRFVSSCYTVEGNRSVRREWNISASKRGVFTIDSVVLTSCDTLGINEVSMPIKTVDTKVTVLPLEVDAPELDDYVRGILGEFQTRSSLLTDAFSMRGIREYTGHERLNRVHWKDSAKQAKLMVVEEDYTSDMEVTVYLYLQDNCEETLAEKALSTACTVACRLSEKNVPVRLDSNCGMRTITSFGMQHALNLKRACAEAELSPKSYTLPHEIDSSLLVVVTPIGNAKAFDGLQQDRLILVRR